MTFGDRETIVPCFTPGTTIATPRGERLVEDLREGDRIITRDNGIQEIRWIGHKELTGVDLVRAPHLKPILIKAGALGNTLPERDMLVSPDLRVLVVNDTHQVHLQGSEVLTEARNLVGTDGIQTLDVMSTTYIRLVFDSDEMVLSNGAWTESFQPGEGAMNGVGIGPRTEIVERFSGLSSEGGRDARITARKALNKHEAKLLER